MKHAEVHISKTDRCIGVTILFFEMPHELLCLISIPPNTLGTLLEVFRMWHRVVQDYKVHQDVSIRDWYLELYPCGWQFPWFIYLKMIEISKPQLRSQIKMTDVASPAPRGCGNLTKPPPQNIFWLILILSKSEYIKKKSYSWELLATWRTCGSWLMLGDSLLLKERTHG